MSRYIDANELKPDYIVPSTSTGTVSKLYVSLFQILNAPTADVVEVIRCKDCKWHEWYIRSRLMNGMEYKSDECRKFNMAVTPDWFCADGERRENEHDL